MTAITPNAPESSLLDRDSYPPVVQVVRHFISFLKWRFSLLPPGSYHWDPSTESKPDQTGSEVFIGGDTPIKTQVVGQRPAITVLRSSAQFQGVGIGDMAFTQFSTGAVVKMDIIPTNIMVNVLSRIDIEAERLAWFCQEQIWTFREEILKKEPTILYTGARINISPPSGAGALVDSTDTEWTVVVLAIPTWLQHSTTKMPLNKKILRKVTTTVSVPVPTAPPAPIALLQGTSVAQPIQTPADRLAAVSSASGGALPQEGPSEAQSSEPLTVKIVT